MYFLLDIYTHVFVMPECHRFSAIAARELTIDAYVLHVVLYLRLRHDHAALLRTSNLGKSTLLCHVVLETDNGEAKSMMRSI